MLKKLMTYGVYGKCFCGVEHSSINGIESIHGLLLKQHKNEFSIHKEFEVDSVVDLKNHIEAKQHVFVTINTEKVLFKVLEGEFEQERALTIAFPNLKITAFYYHYHTANDKTYVAICRKDAIERMLKNYELNQLNVVGFSLGNLGVSHLEGFIDIPSIQTSNSIVSIANNAVSDITINDTASHKYTINGLQISNTSILSLAGILSYYMNTSAEGSNFTDTIDQLKQNFKHKRIFDLGLKFGLGIIFISLLISFMLFTHYASKVEELTSSLTVNKAQKTTLLKLTDEVTKKKKLLNDFSLTSSKSSWYLDQLGQMIPNSVVLSELQWQPITTTIKENKQVATEEHTILIKGIAHRASDFSQWIDNLEQQKWIETVSILAYGKGKKSVPVFELKIVFKI